ncbi:MAG: DUF2064 domain-containing protein, partial [Burkholderiales bacterium]
DLWTLRTGRPQDVAVDTRQATASLRSGHYLKMDGAEVSTERNTIMGVYPAQKGRWSYLHCNFPNHRAAALKVLGVPENRDAVRKAVAQWDALELEEAIIAAKGAGGMVRTMDEWARHPQGAAVATLPLMEIIRIGDSPPGALPAGNRPLSGIRVLDLTRVIAGPTCARTLAEHGADVLKISAAHLPSLGRQEYDTGHGKLSAYLDLREEKHKEILRGLVREADIFAQGYRRALVIGTDLPTLPGSLFGEALALLDAHDLVLGPAQDGGYYLIGLRKPAPELFTGIPWSTDRVLALTQTKASAAGLKTALLPIRRDIDTLDDLLALIEETDAGHDPSVARPSRSTGSRSRAKSREGSRRASSGPRAQSRGARGTRRISGHWRSCSNSTRSLA